MSDGIVHVVEPRADGCVVRCLAGEVTHGTTFTHVRTPSGETHEVRLCVAAIWRYEGVPVPALDPGHAARLHLTGTGLADLRPGDRLLGA